MFYNLAPLQRKPSVSFSQGMCRHLAPGRAACAQDGPRQAALSGSSPGQMWHPGPTCANWHWPQESAPRWECPGLAPALGSAGKELLPEASRTFSRGLFASLGCLERLGLSCSLGRRVWAACSARPRDLCPKLCQPRLHSSSTFTTAVTQSLLNRGEQPHLAKLHWVCMVPRHKSAPPALVSVTQLSHLLQGCEHSYSGGAEYCLHSQVKLKVEDNRIQVSLLPKQTLVHQMSVYPHYDVNEVAEQPGIWSYFYFCI